ncbi:MAG: (Fe-S)-binding protein [Bacteroidetes bacterium]|nr:MAG: (Fe-S)-binding protein [Bacteroidota bacterium]
MTAETMLTTVKEELNKRFNRLVGTSSTNLCTHCGWCIEACHIYQATGDPDKSPVAKAEKVRRVLKTDHDWMSKIFPSWTGAKKLSEEDLEEWLHAAYRDCTLCERCVINCPLGVETPQILAAARGALTAVGKNPEILTDLAEIAISRGENLDSYRDSFKHHMTRFEKLVQDKLKDPEARIPMEEQADILYVPLSGAHTIVPAAVVFNKAGASWTMSMFEASNYGLFMADGAKAKKITQRILDEAERLNVKEVVVSECGHAYGIMKWEAPKWFGGQLPFKVRSILEVLDEYVAKGLVKMDQSKVDLPVTYHDPCNIGRKGGIFEEPRNVIKASVKDYREMTPSKVESYCCGGGSGMVACAEWEDDRLLYGKVKADQIKGTGARRVITSCDNCIHQIMELGEYYELDIEVSNVSQLLMDTIIVED